MLQVLSPFPLYPRKARSGTLCPVPFPPCNKDAQTKEHGKVHLPRMSSLPLFLGQNYDGILIQGHKEMGLEQASLRVRCMSSTGTARAWSTHTPKTHMRSQPQDISPNREIHTAESTAQCRKAVDKLTQHWRSIDMNLTDCLFWGRIYSQTTQEYYFHRKGVALYGGNFYAPGQESKFRCKSFVLTSSECKFLGTIQP